MSKRLQYTAVKRPLIPVDAAFTLYGRNWLQCICWKSKFGIRDCLQVLKSSYFPSLLSYIVKKILLERELKKMFTEKMIFVLYLRVFNLKMFSVIVIFSAFCRGLEVNACTGTKLFWLF